MKRPHIVSDEVRARPWLLAVDPGAVSGIACFLYGGLQWARSGPAIPYHRGAYSCLDQIRVVAEVPIERRDGTGRRAPVEDLITLAIRLGRVTSNFPEHEIELVTPHAWKGNLSKTLTRSRVMVSLSDEEKIRVGEADHNAIDAIGLGLYALGRWPR